MNTSGSNHGDKRALIVKAIVAGIVSGDFRGGDRLVTQELADKFGVSLTPVREALAELAGIGVVDLLPNRGATIHRFSGREILEVSRVRRALECEAIRGAVGRIPSPLLLRLQSQLAQLLQDPIKNKRQISLARRLDSQLHDAIARYSGNAFLHSELRRLTTLFRSLRDASWVDDQHRCDSQRLAEEAREHLDIIEALVAGDRSAAVTAMRRHIRVTSQYWLRIADAQTESPARHKPNP